MGEGIGRVWVLWNPTEREVDLVSIREQLIKVKVNEVGKGIEFFISEVYAHNVEI